MTTAVQSAASTLALLVLFAGLTLGSDAAAAPLLDRVSDALAPQACDGEGCWTNHLRSTDLDNDGDLDIVLANYPDFFSGGDNPQPLVVYINDGSGNFTNNSAAALHDYTGNVRMVAIGDVDGDGAPDIYAPDAAGKTHALFVNDGAGLFTDEADLRLPNNSPMAAAARMGDVDGDGDLDIFVADGYASAGPPFGHLYLNDGAGMFDEALGAVPSSISGSDIDDVELFDADRDFDLDLIVNAHTGGTGALWLNDGNGSFTAQTTIAPPATLNYHYNVAPCDVDGDGDLDLWIDNIGGGFTEQLLINDGAGNFSDETGARVTGNPGDDDNGVICVDIDDDGDLDAVVISLASPERLLENDGSGNFTYVADSFPGPTDCSLWAEFGDLNGDARLDLVTAQGECSSSDEVYFGNNLMPVDSQAPRILAVDTPPSAPANTTVIVHVAISDQTITDEGPRLARAYARTTEPDGTTTELTGKFIGGDLFRVELPAAAAGPINVELCAEDRAGNIACSDPRSYEITNDTGDTETGDASPATDADTACACTQSPTKRSLTDLGLLGLLALPLLALTHRRRRHHPHHRR